MSSLLTLIGTGGVATGVMFCLRRLEKIGRQKVISSRTLLSDTEICNQFYAGTTLSNDTILHSWRHVGRVLGVEYGKLRPSDRLEDLVGLPKWIGSDGRTGVDALNREIEDAATADQSLAVDRMQTVGNVIDFFVNTVAR